MSDRPPPTLDQPKAATHPAGHARSSGACAAVEPLDEGCDQRCGHGEFSGPYEVATGDVAAGLKHNLEGFAEFDEWMVLAGIYVDPGGAGHAAQRAEAEGCFAAEYRGCQ